MGGVWKPCRQFLLAPAPDIINSKGGCVGRLTDKDCPAIMTQVIDAIGHGAALTLAEKIMDVDSLGCSTPNPSGILDVADQFLLFRIDTQRWLSGGLMLGALLLKIGELLFPLRMGCLFTLFDILAQSIALSLKQATDHRTTHTMTLVCETPLDVPQATIQPLAVTHRIARGVRLNQR